MNVLGNLNINLDIFYKKPDLPEMLVGDTARVTIYLELPKSKGEEKEKEKFKLLKGLLFQSIEIVNRLILP